MAKSDVDDKELSGLDLFKRDVVKVLENNESGAVVLSGQFRREFKRIFDERFNPKKYGFETTTSFYAYFNQIGDVVKFTRKNDKLAIALKDDYESQVIIRQSKQGKAANDDCSDDDGGCDDDESLMEFSVANIADGFKLLKSHVLMILEDAENQRIDISQLNRLYKGKFNIPFKKKNYKIKGKLKKVLEQSLSNSVDFDYIGTTIYIQAKRNNDHDVLYPSPTSTPDGSIKGYKRVHHGSVQIDSEPVSSCSESQVVALVQQRPFMSVSSNVQTLTAVYCPPDLKSVHTTAISESTSNANSQAFGLQLTQQCTSHDPDNVKANEPSSTNSSALKGIELLKADVKNVLNGKGKVHIDAFETLYQLTFKKNCRGGIYQMKQKKVSSLLRNIPDVVTVEKRGSDLYVELKDQECKTKENENPAVNNKQVTTEVVKTSLSPLMQTSSYTYDLSKCQQSTQEQINTKSHEQQNYMAAPISPGRILLNQDFNSLGRSDNKDQEVRSAESNISSKAISHLTGLELFSHEVRQVLPSLGKTELGHFKEAYKSKFDTSFDACKYKIKGSKKLGRLMEKIPEVVKVSKKRSKVFVELIDVGNHSKESAVVLEPSASNLMPLPLESVSIATSTMTTGPPIACTEPKQTLSTPEVLLEQHDQTQSLLGNLITLKPRQNADKSQSRNIENERMLFSPSPFEDSFHVAQEIQPIHVFAHPVSRHTWTPQKLNELAKRTISEITEDGNYVSIELVKAKMCLAIGVRNLNEVGCRNTENDIPELQELKRLHAKLDLYGRAYVMVHSIATLTELGQSMARLLDKKDFEELNVGPLEKLPVVYDLFKAPSDNTVMQNITTIQVLKNLNKYLTKEDKWTSKVALKEFLQFLCEEYGCESAYELGVRIQSIGLGISVIKRAQKAQSERSKQVEQELIVDLEKDFQRRCIKIKDDLMGSSHKDERSLLGKLLGSSVTDILISIFEHCEPAFQNHHTIMRKDMKKVESCLETLVGNKALREMFNVALHMGCKSIVGDVLEVIKEEIRDDLEKEEQEKAKAVKPPKKGKLIQEIKQWFSGADDLKLSTLSHIEDRVTHPYHPDFTTFTSFGYGPFLEFVTNQPELNKLLEERSALLGNVTVSAMSQDVGVLDFVQQCGLNSPKDVIEQVLCDHYHVKKLEDLGFGCYDNIISEINHRQRNQSKVFYESALLSKDRPVVPTTSAIPETHFKAGLLGWQKPEDALKTLKTAPLLSDLMEWSQWTLVFEPCLGNLKQFIDQHSNGEIEVLETSNKSLLRIDTNTTPDKFYEYVDKYDVIGTCGTLVSLVVKSGGIKDTPIALLTNHVRLALSKIGQEINGLTCSQFVLQCLCRMPQSMCIALADRVFLEPFGHVVGTTNSYKQLLSCCEDGSQRSLLHHLGLCLGKSEWTKDFESLMIDKVDDPVTPISLRDLKPVTLDLHVTMEQKQDIDVEASQEETSEGSQSSTSSDGEEEDSNDDISDDTEEEPSQEEDISESSLTSDPCKAIIDTIREEFGIGVHLGEKEEKLVLKLQEINGRSLQRLAAELYNRDTHFVLELVQNADDNSYPLNQRPALMFVVDAKHIVVLNNEVGFNEKNIRALCNVGKSTKGPHQYGYIGQKGIGFKSVFRVTDKPEVHSNGFHICFDAKSGPSGYILPHWVEQDTKGDQSDKDDSQGGDSDEGFDGWMTRIVLPLKDEFHSDKKTSLSARFHDVHPSLLLFLHRLRSIIIVKDSHVQQMTREDLKDGIIEIKHGEDTNRWLVVKKQLDASQVREDVDKTELALAFPMPEDMNNLTVNKTLPPQNVFAYLPLRSYGFKFIIQGDFEVPSSREDIDQDKAWNQWLREEIPQLFIDALEVFKQHPCFSGLQALAKFFQFVPLEEEILGFFTPVASTILKKLQGIPCLPVEKHLENETTRDPQKCDWMQPCTVVVCDDPVVRSFITPYLLHKHLNLNYIVQEVASTINPAMRTKLGVRTLSANHVIDIGRAVLADSPQYDVKWIAKWLHCLYCCLKNEHNSSKETLNDIASIKMIPLSDGNLVNLKDNAVFFPLATEQSSKTKKKKSKASYLPALECDLSVLHPELLTQLDEVPQSLVRNLLCCLGVKSWSPSDVIHNHIIPMFQSQKWKEKTDEVLKSYVVYIFDQWMADNSVCSIDEVKKCCQVLTNKGPVNPLSTPVHFTTKYGNKLDLKAQLPSINWTLLDNSYVDLSMHNHVTSKEWQSFFIALGVGHFLAIERKTTKLTKMNLSTSLWASYHNDWPPTSDGCYIVDDYYCAELEEFMANECKDPVQAKVIAETLDQLWEKQYSKYAEPITVKDIKEQEIGGVKTLASFMIHLREGPWLPALGSKSCDVPRKLFCDTEELHMLLDEHVRYTAAKFEDKAFIDSIGLVSTISVEDLLKHLSDWSSSAQNSGVEGFKTSIHHMRNVFAFLHERFKSPTSKTIADAFKKSALIFVPKESSQDPSKRVQGMFFSLKEVCWNDPSGVTLQLQQTKKYTPKQQLLSTHYHNSHDFLRLDLKVDLTPQSDEYIKMAAVLVEESSVPTPTVIEPILKIFAVLGEKCLLTHQPTSDHLDSNESLKINKDLAQYFQQNFKEVAIFPCGEKWITLSEKPIYSDNKHLKKIFEKEKGVYFITLESSQVKARLHLVKRSKSLEEKKQHHIKAFFSACGISKLSEIMREELQPKNAQYQCYDTQIYFHKVVPYIQRYLYFHVEDRYYQLQEKSFGRVLSKMTFATVEKLEVVYRLTGLTQDVVVVQDIEYGSVEIGSTLHLYSVQQQSNSKDALNKAIIKIFIGTGNSNKFDLFLHVLSTKLDDKKELEGFLEQQEVSNLPDNEEPWFVPEPEAPPSPEPPAMDTFLPPPVQRQKRHDNDGEMYCWPPRSSTSGKHPVVQEHNPTKQKADELWPQPAAPESMSKESQGLEGSQLSSYIKAPSAQISTEKTSESGARKDIKDEASQSQVHSQSAPKGAGQVQQHAATSSDIKPSTETGTAHNSVQSEETTVQPAGGVSSPLAQVPYPSNESILTSTPALQVIQSSTPKTGNSLPSVYSPHVPIPIQDLDFEELSQEHIDTLSPNLSLNKGSENSIDVGYLGEKMVFEHLKTEPLPDGLEREIIWMSQEENLTSPFDLQVTDKPTDGNTKAIVTYIEVKSTSTDDKEYFEISIPELRFAFEQGHSLHLYRIYNVGNTQSLRIIRAKNLAQHLERKSVKLFMVI